MVSDEDERKARRERAMEEYLAQQDAENDRQAGVTPPSPPAKTEPAIPAGWYAHPTMADTQRYWDGHAWTDHIAPGAPPWQRTQEENRRLDGLMTAALLMMIFLPIGGFIAGCVLLTRKALAGTLIMFFSLVSAFVWYEMAFAESPADCHIENFDRIADGLPTRDCPD